MAEQHNDVSSNQTSFGRAGASSSGAWPSDRSRNGKQYVVPDEDGHKVVVTLSLTNDEVTGLKLPKVKVRDIDLDSEKSSTGQLQPAIIGRAMTPCERQNLLDKAWEFINNALEIGSALPLETERKIGIEIEAALLRPDGTYASKSAPGILKALDSNVWHKEAGSGSVEYASSPYLLRPGALRDLARETEAHFAELAHLAHQEGLLVVATGIVPVLHPNQLDQPDMVHQGPHEELINLHWDAVERSEALKKGEPFLPPRYPTVKIKSSDGTYNLTTDDSAWATINALHVTFQTLNHDDALHLFNGLRALTPLMLGVSCNTGSLNGKPLNYQEYRPLIIAESGPLNFNFDSCTGLIVEKAETLRHAFEMTFPQTIVNACPVLSLKSGELPTNRDAFESVREAVFPSIQLRFHPKDDRRILIEYRPLSSQLTVDENLAVATFLTIAADYAAKHPEHVHHVSQKDLMNDTINAIRDGMGGEVTCPIGPHAGARMSVSETTRSIMSMLVRHAIDEQLISRADIELLRPLIGRATSGETNATMLQNDINCLGLTAALRKNQIGTSE